MKQPSSFTNPYYSASKRLLGYIERTERDVTYEEAERSGHYTYRAFAPDGRLVFTGSTITDAHTALRKLPVSSLKPLATSA